jgi:hypothetical protein
VGAAGSFVDGETNGETSNNVGASGAARRGARGVEALARWELPDAVLDPRGGANETVLIMAWVEAPTLKWFH